MIGVAVLGSTGSVGENTLDVLARNPDRFRLVALGAHRNAANQVAVQAFLDRRLNFPEISAVIEAVLTTTAGGAIGALEDVLATDAEARRLAHEYLAGQRAPRTQAARGAHA